MVKKYRKKLVVIEAVQWTGENVDEILEFCKGDGKYKNKSLWISTLECIHIVSVGDFIIKGVNGEFYPCKPDIFKRTYREENN